ncbi:hypothetical protein F2Q69_00013787 [Brassica cretica]|uniref:Uncharacterized protein n=1 Tax=Brassica cretica TaxID=69181 RepID=A0A8S9QU80_BRACR|nr:hypothetical protein F2Q69_00013787 [Brassica cretica]
MSLLGTRRFNGRILGSNGTVVLLQNPEMLLGPKGRFQSPEAALDPEIAFRTRRLSEDPEVDGGTRRSFGNPEVPSDPEVAVGPGGYKEPRGLPFPGEATIGTCWDFAVYRSWSLSSSRAACCFLQKATIRLRGAGYGFGNPSARVVTVLLLMGSRYFYGSRPIPGLLVVLTSILSTLRMRKSLESFYLSYLPGVKDRIRGRSRSFVVGIGVGTS